MKQILIFIFAIIILSACSKPDRIDHQDDKYIYVWQYKGDDSTLVKFNRPVIKELKVMGGHHKNHHIKVDLYDNGNYDCCRLPYDSNIDRCKTVDKAQDAAYNGTPIIGIFQEQFYPIHDFRFIKYK